MAKELPEPIQGRIRLRVMSREKTRSRVLNIWMLECPGRGRGDKMQRYRYNVEKLSDGSWVYLLRPAGLNKGCDFVVLCENWLRYKNGNPRPPKHEDISSSINQFGRKFPRKLRLLLHAIRLVWECKPVKSLIGKFSPRDNQRLMVERILGIVRWMFIEQDITYWAASGRAMLRGHFEEKFGRLP
jgi:hypothetical protein